MKCQATFFIVLHDYITNSFFNILLLSMIVIFILLYIFYGFKCSFLLIYHLIFLCYHKQLNVKINQFEFQSFLNVHFFDVNIILNRFYLLIPLNSW